MVLFAISDYRPTRSNKAVFLHRIRGAIGWPSLLGSQSERESQSKPAPGSSRGKHDEHSPITEVEKEGEAVKKKQRKKVRISQTPERSKKKRGALTRERQ